MDYFGPFTLFNKRLKAQSKTSSFNLTRARIELVSAYSDFSLTFRLILRGKLEEAIQAPLSRM